MWDIYLGYTTHKDDAQHWELVFDFDSTANDDSMTCQCPPCKCPGDCSCTPWPDCSCGVFDEDNFWYDEDAEKVIANCHTHVCHMRTRSTTGERWFELVWLENTSALIERTSRIGTFTDVQLSVVESICTNVEIPEKGHGNCQTWIHDALIAIDVAEAADLNDYEHLLNEVFLAYELCDECGEAAEEPDVGSNDGENQGSGEDSDGEGDGSGEEWEGDSDEGYE